jgi:predicted transcriptional regulator
VLDKKYLEFVEALRSLDVPRNVAMLISFLASMSEANSMALLTIGLGSIRFALFLRGHLMSMPPK